MVDIGAVAGSARQARQEAERGIDAGTASAEVRHADDVALATYETFCRKAVHAQAQHPVWVRAWVMATGADAFFVTLRRNGRPVLMLALEVMKEGPFRVASFMGERHANGNFAAFTDRAVPVLSAQEVRTVADAVRAARPDVDLILLERQVPAVDGADNPLSGLRTMRSPNIALATDLAGGMDAVLGRMSGKRKRKKYKLQLRKFDEAGGYRWFEASTPDEVERLISEFYVLKAARFKKRGIPDTFASAEVRAFFRQLFHDALTVSPPPFVLHGIEVAGEIRGINGFSVTDTSLVCEFCAIRDDDPTISPGFYLDYVGIEEACKRGKAVYDFSIGDDDYKRTWCDMETVQFDTLLPLTLKGRLLAATLKARAGAVRLVKSNKRLWATVKSLRTRLAGRA